MDRRLCEEASSFDRQIKERVSNGHVPDLRRCGRCEYFYNNVWRDQVFADLFFGGLVRRFDKAMRRHLPQAKPLRVLEVGCGPGHFSLELARHGHDVTGVDVSRHCIETAQRFADEDPLKQERGKLTYHAGDIYSHQGEYDAVVFVGAMHHFPDSCKLLDKVHSLLADRGLILVDEPTHERVTRKNAAVLTLVRLLLSAVGAYYQALPTPQSGEELDEMINKTVAQELYETDDGEKLQSVNDSEATFRDMLNALQQRFTQLELLDNHAIFTQLVGGIRLKTPEQEHAFARALQLLDVVLCQTGATDSVNFTFIGQKP